MTLRRKLFGHTGDAGIGLSLSAGPVDTAIVGQLIVVPSQLAVLQIPASNLRNLVDGVFPSLKTPVFTKRGPVLRHSLLIFSENDIREPHPAKVGHGSNAWNGSAQDLHHKPNGTSNRPVRGVPRIRTEQPIAGAKPDLIAYGAADNKGRKRGTGG